MISTLKIKKSEAVTLIEKIKAEIKNRAEAKAKRMLLKRPKGWPNASASRSARRYHGFL